MDEKSIYTILSPFLINLRAVLKPRSVGVFISLSRLFRACTCFVFKFRGVCFFPCRLIFSIFFFFLLRGVKSSVMLPFHAIPTSFQFASPGFRRRIYNLHILNPNQQTHEHDLDHSEHEQELNTSRTLGMGDCRYGRRGRRVWQEDVFEGSELNECR